MGLYSEINACLIGGCEKSRKAVKAAIHRKYVLNEPDCDSVLSFETNHYWEKDPEFFAALSKKYPDVIIELKKYSGLNSIEAFRFRSGEIELVDGSVVFEPFETILTDRESRDLQRQERKRVSNLFDEALKALQEIRTSGYWPYASPAPCSTEVALRNSLNASVAKLEDAILLHKSLYRHPDANPTEPPCVSVRQLH